MIKDFRKWLKKDGYDCYPDDHKELMYIAWKAAIKSVVEDMEPHIERARAFINDPINR